MTSPQATNLQPLTGLSRPLLLGCGGSFLAFLDVTITNLAVPAVQRDFGGLSIHAVSWVITLYTILFAALLAPAGRMADTLGRRKLFGIGLATFTAASLLAAVAPSFGVLLVARAGQGVGAAALMPASLALVLADTAAHRRAAAIGWWSAAAALAAATGPVLGGVLVNSFGWRSLFVINLPAGVLLGWLAVRLPASATRRGRAPDLLGTALLTAGIGLLLLALTNGPAWGWTGLPSLSCLLGAAALISAALRRSARHPRPAIEVGLWHSPAYASANAVSLLFGAALYATLLLGVLFLTQIWRYSELQAGLAMSPGAAASAAVGITLGRLSRRPSPRILTAVGALGLAATSAALAVWLPATPHFLLVWLPAGLITGVAVGALSNGVSTAAALSVPPPRFGAATGLNIAARQVGGAFGVAVLAILLTGHRAADVSAYQGIYVFCTLACLTAALLAARLVLPTQAPPAPLTAADAEMTPGA
ncbi:MAG: MFS transporter [Pseudonocardiales bacterium]|nr:MAG: MFS transporter [Pseudonocardiales bacterium]